MSKQVGKGTNGNGSQNTPPPSPPSTEPTAAAAGSTPAAHATPAPQEKFTASIHPTGEVSDFVGMAATALEIALGKPVIAIIQQGQQGKGEYGLLDEKLHWLFYTRRSELPTEPFAVLLHSPGGTAQGAHDLARLFRKVAGGFTVIVPSYAKSAATLFSLGADQIIMGTHAELGPLDVQFTDHEREERLSALDEVHALERLQAEALEAVDRTVLFLKSRTKKKWSTVLPLAAEFATTMMRPLLEKMDVVHYTQMSRLLKVAEEYAIRLLRHAGYDKGDAAHVARQLVSGYPEHEFVIDLDEAKSIGLKTAVAPSQPIARLLDLMTPGLVNNVVLGRVKAVNG